jgi:hypothetical protein
MSKQLKLKNYFFINNPQQMVFSIQEWMSRLMLHGPASRNRTRFVRMLADRVTEIDKERVKMLIEVADKKTVVEKDDKGKEKKVEKVIFLINEKDENGRFVIDPKTRKPKVKGETTVEGEGDTYKISDENNKKFEEEWKEYLNEDLVLDITPATADVIYGARDIVLKTEEEFTGRMAVLYDEWCLAFENISDAKESKKSKDSEPKEPKE